MLLVVVSFGQEPELVAPVIEPAARVRRKIFAFILGINKEIVVVCKHHLHEPASKLRYDDQLYPRIGNLLRLPTLEILGFHATIRGIGSRWPTHCLARSYAQKKKYDTRNCNSSSK